MRTRLLGGLGALLTLGAAAVVAVPGVEGSVAATVELLASQDPERLLLALGSVVGAYAAWAARSSPVRRPPTHEPSGRFVGVGDRPESVTAADRVRTGSSFDDRVADACAGDDDALGRIRTTLADTAATAYARAADQTPDRARQAVAAGAWTDDPIAAAFLAGESGPSFPLVARLRAWLDPAAERRRRVERTVAAVDTILDGDPTEATAGGDGGDR